MGYGDNIQHNAFESVLGTSALPASPPASSGGSLQSMLGLDDNQMQRLAGGLGAGLTAAANNWNKPGLAAFAGGAGGALQGSSQAQQQQVDNRLKAVQAALQAWQAGDIGALRRAQAEYYRAITPKPAAAEPARPVPPPAQAVHAAIVNPPEPAAPASANPASAPPERPPGVPPEAVYSPLWRAPDGRLFGADGAVLSAAAAGGGAAPVSASTA